MKGLIPSVAIALGCLGPANKLEAQFTNLDFESSFLLPGIPPPAAMPGWTVSCSIADGYPIGWRGAVIGVFLNGAGGTWTDGQGTYIVMISQPWIGVSTASIAQTGSLSPSTRSLHCRLAGNLVVSFAGESLSCVTVSSHSECAADISKFAGTTGELKFEAAASSYGYLDSIWFSDQSVSNLPPTAPTVSVSKTSDSSLRLTFPAQLGTTYLIQATTNLLNWETVGSIQATNDPTEFFDNPAASYNIRYYRVAVPP